MVHVKRHEPWSFGAELMQRVAADAEQMSHSRQALQDKHYQIGAMSEIWLCPQLALDHNQQIIMTWWVRWVDMTGNPIESHYCTHVLMIVACVASVLDKAGVKI